MQFRFKSIACSLLAETGTRVQGYMFRVRFLATRIRLWFRIWFRIREVSGLAWVLSGIKGVRSGIEWVLSGIKWFKVGMSGIEWHEVGGLRGSGTHIRVGLHDHCRPAVEQLLVRSAAHCCPVVPSAPLLQAQGLQHRYQKWDEQCMYIPYNDT